MNGLTLVPISNAQTAGVTASSDVHQLVQSPVSSVAVASAAPATSYYVVRSAPAQSNLVIVPANTQTSSASAAAAGPGSVDNDYAVLSSGFGNRLSKISELEQTLQGKLGGLLSGAGKNLGSSDLTSMLMGDALTFLSNNSYAGLISDAVPIVTRIIGRVLQKNGLPAPAPTPAPTPDSSPSIRPGGQTSTIQGNAIGVSQTFTITITVTPGLTPTVTPGSSSSQTQSSIQGPNQDPNPQTNSHQTNSSTLPANLPTLDGARPASPPGN